MSGTKGFITHPFREAILQLLSEHFDEAIAKNFQVEFEANKFTRELEHIWRQVKDEKFVVEVYYKTGPDTRIYICDLMSWESKVMTSERLFTYISNMWSGGKIGDDWILKGGRIGVASDALAHETITRTSGRDVPATGRLHARRKAARKADR